jgi:hypothetical protein
MRPKINAAICPLCGEPNDCALAADPDAAECWCDDLEFPQELLDQVPINAVHQTCICRTCLERYNESRVNDEGES